MAYTISDVAARAGVSKTTVSRVLNGKGDLHESTALRIRQVMEELGYVPSSRGVSRGGVRSSVVAMLVPSLSWPWVGDIVEGAVDVIEEHGLGIVLFTCNRTDQSMQRFASRVSASTFDGLLVINQEGTLDYIGGLHTRSRPVIVIDDRMSNGRFPSVSTTNETGARQAAEHLLALGRRQPLVVSGIPGLRCTDERLSGFLDTYAAAGLPVPPDRIAPGEFTFASGAEAVERLVAEAIAFDAVFAANDLSAAGALASVQAAGLRVPEDVAVIGFDDVPLAARTTPALSTVQQPCREMGRAAASMLMQYLDGSAALATDVVLPTTLVVRGSTLAA
ncbi:LacI family DNA-binding transcriptional regulator [Nocardioides sp.]|uniref:LacI family DNA-binding transcriptional regulator n=1 Tax=Nocardioides sp. TaxID=35761 RepID=UPI002CEB1BF1|nr:LacI family DNA-binding transcriptional regulator [Nocardioides sp.]HXH80801.1 LacI family DNA-binding transcriptional regulator [Nocardioides sp.]